MGLSVFIKMSERVVGRHPQSLLACGPIRRWVMGRALALMLVGAGAGFGVSPQALAQTSPLPSLGETEGEAFSAATERRIGEQIVQQLRGSGALLDDPIALDYLRVQAFRLLQSADRRGELGPDVGLRPEEFEVFLVADASLNAFALPGGFIGIHTGLISQVGSESELMSVLAHEIGHVTQRHIARMIGQSSRSTPVLIAASLLAVLAAGSSPDAAVGLMSLGQTLSLQEQLAFSRDAEREADRVGLGLMQATGFDPQGMVSLFEKLGKSGRFNERTDAPGWLRTHPLSGERVAAAQLRIQQIPDLLEVSRRGRESESFEFLVVQARVYANEDRSVEGYTRRLKVLDAALAKLARGGVADLDRRPALLLSRFWVRLGLRDWPAAEVDLAAAEKGFAASGRTVLAGPHLDWARAQLQAARGRTAEASRLLGQLSAKAGSGILARATARQQVSLRLEGGEDAAETLRLARQYIERYPRDLEGYRLASQAAERSGQQAYAHAYAAEQLVLAGALPAAYEQIEMARRAPGLDFLEASRVDARAKEIRRMVLTEARLRERER